MKMTLDMLKRGEPARVLNVGGEGALRFRLLDLGFVPGTEVKIIRRAPFGDPIEVMLRGYRLTLRQKDAATVEVIKIGGTRGAEDGGKEL